MTYTGLIDRIILWYHANFYYI